MKRKYSKKPADNVKIAKERINELFDQAEKAKQEYSNRYVELARKIAMKYKVRIPPTLKKKFCKHCNEYLRPGVNCRVRTREGKIVYYCSNCKKYMRFPVLKSKK